MRVWIDKDFREKFFTEVSSLPISNQRAIINEIYRERQVRAITIRGSNLVIELRGGILSHMVPSTEKFMRSFITKHYPELLI